MIFAPKVEQSNDGLASPFIISNGNPIRVWGIIFLNTSDATPAYSCILQNGDGTKDYIELVINQYYEMTNTPFVADEGLRIALGNTNTTSSANIRIMVFYSQEGS